MDAHPRLFFSIGQFVHVVASICYIALYFIASRLFVVALAPAYLIEKLSWIQRSIDRRPLLYLCVSVVAVAYTAAVGLNTLFGGDWYAMAVSTVAWSICLSVVAVAYFDAVTLPVDIREIEALALKRWPERWYAGRLKQPVDAIYVRYLIANSIVMIPAILALVLPARINVWNAAFYVLALMVSEFSHENLDHTDIHNRLFHRGRAVAANHSRITEAILWLTDKYLRFVLNPVCGRIPHFYRAQHIYMHHVENNGVHDLQTTVFRDRTSFFDYCRQSLKLGFTFSLPVDLIFYFAKRGNWREIRRLLAGLAAWFLLLGLLALHSPLAAVLILVVRFLSGPGTALLGYFWHGLVAPGETENAERSSVDISIGDGQGAMAALHARHHLRGGEHWSRQFELREMDRKRCEDGGTVVLKLMHREMYLKALICKRFDYIARNIVWIGQEDLDMPAKERFIAERLLPVSRRPRLRLAEKMDDFCGKFFASVMLWGRL